MVVDAGVVADGVVVDSNTEFDVMVPVDAVLTPLNERVGASVFVVVLPRAWRFSNWRPEG